MDATTGSLLRRITQTELSVSAHKLATLILDAIAWKDGYNGLDRGTAAFTLAALGEKMKISRQYLSVLLSELENSPLQLTRHKPHGKYSPWLFRFGDDACRDASGLAPTPDDTSLYIEESNKTIFTGMIDTKEDSDILPARWAELIKAAKTTLPCWDVDVRVIWERFLAFNKRRGNERVPAGFLLGFMRRWRKSPSWEVQEPKPAAAAPPLDAQQQELMVQIRAAPSANRQFHASDLCRAIGDTAYNARVMKVITRFGCARFTAMLAVHGQAVMTGEIAR